MKTSINCFVHFRPDPYAEPDAPLVFEVFPFDMSEHDRVLVGQTVLEFDVPENFNPLQSEINGLEKQLDKLAEQYHASAAAIRNRISNLQCIEHSPVSAK